ncbi:MAG TPA: helicase C-terminal domain-containing protein [Gemmatimonadales bacterium]|nr:helicase C-terminal domain-containing protein [Gemmatimonadales bacterium]
MTSRLSPPVRDYLSAEISAAGGREVCFVATLDINGVVIEARAVARGTADMVLALPGIARAGQMVLHNHPSGLLEPSPPDLHVAARLHDGGVGFGILNNSADALYVVVEVAPAAPETRLDPLDVVETLGERGPIAPILGAFEDRPSQRDMAAHISDAYNDGGVVLLEAGTGVGKSFAYLVPALAWARANKERTIVSTNTINLQEQLVGKDLPVLARALEQSEYRPTWALLKGWRNYLCLSRLEQAMSHQQSLLEPERLQELVSLTEWASRTSDGTLADLPAPPTSEVWDEVAAESDICTRLRCPHFDRCFLFRARRRAAEADIVVVNHHLLTADLAIRQASDNWQDAAVLPPYQRLILDEAHHLEDVSAAHLGLQVTSRGVRRMLARFERNGRGLVPALALELSRSGDMMSRASLDVIQQRLLPALVEARRASEAVFSKLFTRLAEVQGGVLRIEDSFPDDPVWEQGLGPALHDTLLGFRRLRDAVEIIADRLSSEDLSEKRLALLTEIRAVLRRIETTAEGLAQTLQPAPQGPPTVRWIERTDARNQHVGLHAVPLDLAPILRETLFDRLKTVVMTSATLAAGGEFDFLERRTGLAIEPNPVTVKEILPSPFDFTAQCVFGVPTDFPDPRDDELGHDQAVAHVVEELAAASDGGMFVLFTSHGALRRAASALRLGLGARWPLLVQGEAPRDQLLRRFRDSGRAILLGTDSFWEGVDVPGRALRALVLCKLPFKVPSEPLTAARLERLSEQGEDGFWSYLLPHAALKLKQGFGRLIRSRSDVGVVVLLDRRVAVKRYGPLILEGLPPAERVIGPWAQVRTRCEDFFAQFGIGAEV